MDRGKFEQKKEKEITLEDVEEYFEKEKDFYSEKGRKKIKDSVLKLKLAERWRKIAGYEKEENKKTIRIEGLLDRLEKNKERAYEGCLAYIEEILGSKDSVLVGGKNMLDLINYEEYGPEISRERSKDIESKDYQSRKNYLRKLADILTGEVYKKREFQLNKPLLEKDLINLAGHVADVAQITLLEAEQEFKKGKCRRVLEFLDKRIYQQCLKKLSEEGKRKKEAGIKASMKAHREELFRLRRYRRYFLKKYDL